MIMALPAPSVNKISKRYFWKQRTDKKNEMGVSVLLSVLI